MKDRFYWDTHRGKRILINDYSEMSGEDFIAQVIHNREEIRKIPDRDLLVLVHARNAFVSKEVLNEMKTSASEFKEVFDRTAIVTDQSIQKFFINVVNKVTGIGARAFDDVDSAKDWLVTA